MAAAQAHLSWILICGARPDLTPACSYMDMDAVLRLGVVFLLQNDSLAGEYSCCVSCSGHHCYSRAPQHALAKSIHVTLVVAMAVVFFFFFFLVFVTVAVVVAVAVGVAVAVAVFSI